MRNEQKLMEMLNEGLISANEEGWINEDLVKSHFKDKFKMNKIKCSSKLQKELGEITKFCKEKNEPICLEVNDKENLIIMSSETYNRREKMLELYEQLVYIEAEKIINNKQYTIDELDKYLDNIISSKKEK